MTILCESLATDDRYVAKHPTYFEPDHYFCWVDYHLADLAEFIDGLRAKWLED